MKFLVTDLEDIPGVTHGFFTRDAEKADAAQALDTGLVTVKQVHGAKAVVVDAVWSSDPPEADALVTSRKNLGLAIVTADCAPVLFASRKTRVVGAAHAGWRGALNGVLEATLSEMKKLGAEVKDIEVAIGPCIAPQSYEVSAGFEKPFLTQDAGNARFFERGREGHLMFDLPGYVCHRLTAAGVSRIHDTRQDTLANEGSFCSYRRSTLRGEKNYGRQLSVIALK